MCFWKSPRHDFIEKSHRQQCQTFARPLPPLGKARLDRADEAVHFSGRYTDRIRYPDVHELLLGAELVDGRGRDAQSLATSRTVRSDAGPPTAPSNSHTKGVPSELQIVVDRSEMGGSVWAAFLGFPTGCNELPAPPSSAELTVTPEATGSSPVHPAIYQAGIARRNPGGSGLFRDTPPTVTPV